MKKPFIIHPFLMALYPVVTLYEENKSEFPFSVVLWPLAKFLGAAILLYAVLSWVLKDRKKSALAVSLTAIVLFTRGHVTNLLPLVHYSILGLRTNTAHLVAVGAAVLLGCGLYFAVKTKKDLGKLTQMLNVVAVALVAIPAVSIVSYEVKNYVRTEPMVATAAEAPPLVEGNPGGLPNIYYIILDGYTREDNLKATFGYDNSEFTGWLREKGFYVVSQSRANYPFTFLSVSSSLNMEYLDALVARVGEDSQNRGPAWEMMKHSRVRSYLRKKGYRLAAFGSVGLSTIMADAELFLGEQQEGEFENGILKTPLSLSDRAARERARRMTLFTLEGLPGPAESENPLFVLAHVLCPHPPYVFGRDGSLPEIVRAAPSTGPENHIDTDRIIRADVMKVYVDQVAFVNEKVKKAIAGILERSRIKPVIIVQGDHGSGAFQDQGDIDNTYLQDRMSILNAIYLPYEGADALYETMTPVNTFRVVLNACMGADFDLLPDRSYVSEWERPFRLYDVTDEIGSEQDRLRYERLMTQDFFAIPGVGEISRKGAAQTADKAPDD